VAENLAILNVTVSFLARAMLFWPCESGRICQFLKGGLLIALLQLDKHGQSRGQLPYRSRTPSFSGSICAEFCPRRVVRWLLDRHGLLLFYGWKHPGAPEDNAFLVYDLYGYRK